MANLKERLAELREERNITQKDLADQTNLSVRAISRWETGVQLPSIDSVIILAKFFNCSTDYLLGLED